MEYNYRIDVFQANIKTRRDVIFEMDYPEVFKYKVDRNTPLTLRIFWETSRRSIGNSEISN